VPGNNILIYPDERSPLPEDVVCLEFASLLAKCGVPFACMLSTPLRILELQARNQHDLETWSNAILALQVSTVAHTVAVQTKRPGL
jgi:hypothetical protein